MLGRRPAWRNSVSCFVIVHSSTLSLGMVLREASDGQTKSLNPIILERMEDITHHKYISTLRVLTTSVHISHLLRLLPEVNQIIQ